MDRLTEQEFTEQELEEISKELEEVHISELIHFSHHHTLLLLTIPSEEDNEEVESCSICGLPILSSSFYTCRYIICKFFLHKQCARKFPQELLHPSYCPLSNKGHFLFMMNMASPSSSSSGFAYFCEACEIQIHPLSAGLGVEIKIEHMSHPMHPLVATRREVCCECDGCGRHHQGFFFTCRLCSFWIHRDCTLLPKIITLPGQPDPFFLAYSLPANQIGGGDCVVCRIQLRVTSSNFGVYFCPQSRTFAHVACGTRDKSASKKRDEVISQLPEDERGDEFPSRVIRRYAETNPLGPGAYYKHILKTSTDLDDAAADLIIERYHKQHPLTLATAPSPPSPHDDDTDDATYTIPAACDLCTQPVTSSSSHQFYRCLDLDCRFAAHKICEDALPNIDKFFIPYGADDAISTELYPDPGKRFFNSIFYCIFCRRPCNGVCSQFDFHGARPCIDLECMAAPITINHASNPKHLLFRTHHNPSAPPPLSCCTADTFLFDVYRCFVCNYSIHMSCAMLPKRIHFREYHRRHPLYLIYPAISIADAADDCYDFCEVCEEHIDLRYWTYRCVECDESYHISCIPSVGYLSKVKFGGTLTLPSSVHDHPLTLERMLTVPSQRCGGCKEIVKGMVDEMAFFCSLCHFWLHFTCAGNSVARQKLLAIAALLRC